MWHTPAVQLALGQVVARRYRVERSLGEGGSARTYLVRDLAIDCAVALKVLARPDLSHTLVAEFDRLRGLYHPHLAVVHDLGREGPLLYYTSELVDGPDLSRWVETARSWEETLTPFADALEALAYLHAIGVRHGDVKTENVVVRRDGRGVLIDLGCAALLGLDANQERRDAVSGTPGMIAPELLEGAPADRRADVYSAGVALRALAERARDAPAAVHTLVAEMTARAPADRPTDVGEVLERLGRRSPRDVGPRARASRLVGRERELGRFRDLLDALLAGGERARTLLVQGPDGVGRSRLLREMKWEAQRRCMVVEAVNGPDAVLDALVRASGVADAPPDVRGVVVAHEALTRGEPVVVCVDDVHILPSRARASFDALARLLDRTGRVLLVGSCRSGGGASDARQVLPAGAEQIDVAPLAEADLAAWAGSTVSPSRVRELARATGGFPSYVEAALAHIDGGAPESELARVSPDDRLDFGPFGEPERRALAVLAVHAESVDERVLAASGVTPDALHAVSNAGFVERDASGFRLRRSADVVPLERALEPSLLREAHAARVPLVLASLERAATAESRSRLEAMLVRHLVGADRKEEALARFAGAEDAFVHAPDAWLAVLERLEPLDGPEVSLVAASLLLAAGRPERALVTLLRALRRKPPEPLRSRCRAAIGRAWMRHGAPRRAEIALSRALAGSSGDRAVLLDALARVLIARGRYAEALERATEGLEVARGGDRRADLLESVGVAATYLGDVARAHDALRESSALRGERTDPRTSVRLLSYHAIADARGGALDAAATGHRKALELAERHGLDDQLASTALNLGTVEQELGDWGGALAAYERGQKLARAIGKRSTELALRFNLANLFAAIGLFERADRALADVIAAALAEGQTAYEAPCASLEAELALARGDASSAVELLERALRSYTLRSDPLGALDVSIALADAVRASGDLSGAASRLAALPSGAEVAPDLAARGELLRGRVLLAEGRAADAVPVLERALASALASRQRDLEGEVAATLAGACRVAGAAQLAAAHDERARSAWERIALTLPAELRDAFHAHPRRRLPSREGLPASVATDRAPPVARILEINRRLNSLEPRRVLEEALDAGIELTGAERGFVLLAGEHDGDALDVAVARNLDKERIGRSHLKFSRGIAEHVVRSGEPTFTIDALNDERFRDNASVHSMRLRSVACVPIASPSGVLGAMYLDNRFAHGIFGARDVEVLSAFANQVAVALTNARLHADLERRTVELEREKERVEALLHERERDVERLVSDAREQRAALGHRFDYSSIVGRSAPMRAVLSILDRVIETPLSVLVTGESGTGKELVARAIHEKSPRSDRPFLAVDCGALPEALLESELFGHVRGAFTGADRDRKGLLVAAHGGTVFLDEIGEMPLAMQQKLLRALQEREVRPLGATDVTAIDVRLVCATNRVLRDEVAAGRFREDLYYRIAGVEVHVPALRERMDDLPLLARALLERLAARWGRDEVPSLEPAAVRRLAQHVWPGNVRELENVLARALALSSGAAIGVAEIEASSPAPEPSANRSRRSTALDEKSDMARVLADCDWNVVEACRRLDIPRTTFYRRIKAHGLRRPRG